jgi:hypothetical protein
MTNNEKLSFVISKKKIKVEHSFDVETGKPFEKQENGLKNLKAFLYDEIVFQSKKEGFIPYNNFESSINWQVIEKI